MLANVTAPTPVEPPLWISSVPPLMVAALATPPIVTVSKPPLFTCAPLSSAPADTGVDDRICSRTIHALLAAAVDYCSNRGTAGQYDLVARAIQRGATRNGSAHDELSAVIDDRISRGGSGVYAIETTVVQDRGNRNTPRLLGHDTALTTVLLAFAPP